MRTVLLPVQIYDVYLQRIHPVIQVVPVELTFKSVQCFTQIVPRFVERDFVSRRVGRRYVFEPHVVVVGEIKQRAIHIQH